MKITCPNLNLTHMTSLSCVGWVTITALMASAPPLGSLLYPQPSHASPLQIAQATTLYVNPTSGTDATAAGQNPSTPLRTITFALKQAQSGTVIQLAAGTYNAASGEQFPLILPSGVVLKGDAGTKGAGILIQGGGSIMSPSFATQQVGVLAQGTSQVIGVTVTNPITRGSGVWVETGSPTISDCTFANNHRDGVFVTGSSSPNVLNNVFTQNGGNGISIARNAKGEVRGNSFVNTGFGLAIGGTSTAVIAENQVSQNMDGIVVSDSARPVIRQNQIQSNNRDGIVVIGNGNPDLGQAGTAANNVIQQNKRYDLNNSTKTIVVTVAGNTLDQKKAFGKVNFESATQTPSPAGSLTDIKGHWAQPFIEALAARQIITGFPDGSYRPNDPVTRAQFAAIIAKLNPPAKREAQTFGDVASNFWGFNAITTTYRAGYMSGYPGNLFKPEQQIPRVQVLVALASGLGVMPKDANAVSYYQDASEIPNYATSAVAAATEQRMVVNYPDVKQLSPNRNATRAEVAALVYQALASKKEVPAIASPYIVTPTPR